MIMPSASKLKLVVSGEDIHLTFDSLSPENHADQSTLLSHASTQTLFARFWMPPHNFLQHWTTCAKQADSAVWLRTVKRDVIGMVKYWGGVEVYASSNVYRKSSQFIQHCRNVANRRWDHTWWSESSGIVEIDPWMSATQILSQNSKIPPKTGKRWLFDEEKRLVREEGFLKWQAKHHEVRKFVSPGITEQLWWSTLWCSCNQLTLAVGFQIPRLWRDAKT